MAKAKELLEEIYDIRLSSKAPYHTQFGSLAANGELANMKHVIDTLIRLCEVVDEMEEKLTKVANPQQINTSYEASTTSTGSNPNESL